MEVRLRAVFCVLVEMSRAVNQLSKNPIFTKLRHLFRLVVGVWQEIAISRGFYYQLHL